VSPINTHLGHQIVVYSFGCCYQGEHQLIQSGVFRYLIDGKEAGLCHPSYSKALEAAQLEVETYHGHESTPADSDESLTIHTATGSVTLS
jgi:hypothetical protein